MISYVTRPSYVSALRHDGTRESVQEVAAIMAAGAGRTYRREGVLYVVPLGGVELALAVGDYLVADPSARTIDGRVAVKLSVIPGPDFEAAYIQGQPGVLDEGNPE